MSSVRALLADDFKFEGPLMRANSADEFFQQLENFPFEAKTTTRSLIADGNQVVHVFDFNITAPVRADIPMCELFEIGDDKIAASRLFYDSAKFPKP